MQGVRSTDVLSMPLRWLTWLFLGIWTNIVRQTLICPTMQYLYKASPAKAGLRKGTVFAYHTTSCFGTAFYTQIQNEHLASSQ